MELEDLEEQRLAGLRAAEGAAAGSDDAMTLRERFHVGGQPRY